MEIQGLSDYGFGYDRLGNLTQRTQARGQDTLTEDCTYDDLNRLSTSTKSGSATYDALGNILTRSDVVGTYLYGTSRPHAVTTAGGCTYLYDANGNIIRRDRNGVYEFTANWNSFNKPVSLFAMLEGSEFEYDVNGKRTQQLIFEDGGQVVRKKIYIAETYEIEEVLANPTESDRSLWQWTPVHSRIYVDTPVGRVGIRQQAASTDGTGAVTRSYLHKDHLGSVVAVSDDAANIAYYSFDAWGNRRDASDWSSILPANIDSHKPALTDRGYTGHEQLDHLQLVHMNGRIYDPVIGRMLTPDPLIQAPQNLQSFNRYSYVWNNPLSNTDPSGFVTEKLGSSDSQNGSSNGTKPTVITPENLSMQDLLNTISEKVNCTSESSTERKTFSEDGGSSTTTESADITRDVISNASTGSGESSEESATEENPKFKNGLSKSYGTKEETIIAAIDHLLGKKSDNEWGGYIVKVTGPNGEPMFAFTEPIEGTSNDLDLDPENDEVPVPRDDIISAYHTHTPGGPNPEEFSGTSEITDGRWYSVGNEVGDKNWSKRYDMPVILGTPTGEIKKYRGYKSSYNESVLDRSDHTWDTVDPL